MKKNTDKRNIQIIQWRKENVSITQAEIARKLGITRQRVQQIERKLNLEPRRIRGIHKVHNFICKQCGKTMSALVSGRIYCSRKCFYTAMKIQRTPDEEILLEEKRKEKNRQRSRLYYHEVFKKKKGWKDLVRERNIKYIEERKKRLVNVL